MKVTIIVLIKIWEIKIGGKKDEEAENEEQEKELIMATALEKVECSTTDDFLNKQYIPSNAKGTYKFEVI